MKYEQTTVQITRILIFGQLEQESGNSWLVHISYQTLGWFRQIFLAEDLFSRLWGENVVNCQSLGLAMLETVRELSRAANESVFLFFLLISMDILYDCIRYNGLLTYTRRDE